MLRSRWSVLVFALWTVFVWSTRVRNAVGDEALSGTDRAVTLGLCASFVVPAVALAVLAVGNRRSPWSRAGLTLVAVVAGWSIGVWAFRAVSIAFNGEHGTAFVAVHLVLAAVSIWLAWFAAANAHVGESKLRELATQSGAASPPA